MRRKNGAAASSSYVNQQKQVEIQEAYWFALSAGPLAGVVGLGPGTSCYWLYVLGKAFNFFESQFLFMENVCLISLKMVYSLNNIIASCKS